MFGIFKLILWFADILNIRQIAIVDRFYREEHDDNKFLNTLN